MEKYITTPIYYASGSPHLGHVYSTFIADALRGFWKLKTGNASLITGTDEYGQKIEEKASDSGITTEQFVDQKSKLFLDLWQSLSISPDFFVRTTDKTHEKNILEVWNRLVGSGDISLGEYTGKYCVDCEQFYSEHQLIDCHCPIHETKVVSYSKPSYLFDLSRHLKTVLTYLEANENFIQPSVYRDKVISFLKQPSHEQLSVSRTDFQWGIPVPENDKHVIYVWVDALFSYLTAIKQLGGSEYGLANTTHIIGKDILVFHGVYWLALLAALDIPFPEQIIVHGWWTLSGKKISKSNPDTIINPAELAGVTTVDGLRYSLLSKKPLWRDGDLTPKVLIETINTGLANNLGNLVKRCTTLVTQYHKGNLTKPRDISEYSPESICLLEKANLSLSRLETAYHDAHLQQVCVIIDELVSSSNTYFHARAPWKDEYKTSSHAQETLQVICSLLNTISIVYSPIIPETCSQIRKNLGVCDQQANWPNQVELLEFLINEPQTIFSRVSLGR